MKYRMSFNERVCFLSRSYLKSLLIMAILAMFFGCGGSSSSGDDTETGSEQERSVTAYINQPSDSFTNRYNMDATYSNGEKRSVSYLHKEVFSQVESIPEKYAYSGPILGPYILKTETEDGLLSGYDYMSALNTVIISDNLDVFKRITDRTVTGSEDPDAVVVGDTYNFSEESTLFDSDTGSESGQELTSAVFTAEEIETVTTEAGIFDALRISCEWDSTRTLRGVTDTVQISGDMWIAVDTCIFVKTSNNAYRTFNLYGLTAIISMEAELIEYSIDTSQASSIIHQNESSAYTLNIDRIIKTFSEVKRSAETSL